MMKITMMTSLALSGVLGVTGVAAAQNENSVNTNTATMANEEVENQVAAEVETCTEEMVQTQTMTQTMEQTETQQQNAYSYGYAGDKFEEDEAAILEANLNSYDNQYLYGDVDGDGVCDNLDGGDCDELAHDYSYNTAGPHKDK